MDLGTVVGLIAGIGLLLASVVMTSGLGPFIDYPAFVMVAGGTFCAVLISFPIRNIRAVAKVIKNGFLASTRDPRDVVADMVKYAEIARREGILALEEVTRRIDDPFVVSGLRMAVDGTAPELIETIMTSELEAVEARHADGKAVLDNMGRYAPAFGMIGTLVGLVIMLKNMDEPKSIGPAMAVALLTTLYGAVISNLICGPLSEKLARRSREEIMLKMLVIRGVMAIQSGDHPRMVEQKLQSFLPNRSRGTGNPGRQAA